jgi:geranylgeranyl diphosphate synthase, type I
LAQGINAGDALHCIARLTMLRLAEHGVDGERTLAAAKLFDETCLSICEGQFLDVQFETRVCVTRAEYGAMIARKTAALIACATKMGALIAGAPTSQQDVMWHFGESLGLAYQVQDDILGIWGDPRVTGKPAADDIRSKKKTLPILFLLEHGSARQRQVLAEAWRQERVEDAGIDAVLDALNEAGARQFAEGEAARLYRSTQEYLAEARVTAASRASLGSLVGSLLLRPA